MTRAIRVWSLLAGTGSRRQKCCSGCGLLTKLLEEAPGFRVVHEISLHHDVGRTFIGVQTPASIVERLDVMDMVVVHNGAGLNAKRADPPISDVTRWPIVYT